MAELAPTRSRTDPPALEDQKTHRPHISRRLHGGSFRSKEHHRHTVKDTVQSAVELKPPINFDHLLRRDKKGSDYGARGNLYGQQTPFADESSAQPEEPPAKIVRTSDVARAKRYNAKREEELKASLKSVEEIGMSSTRQLDDTYYAILEKASILRSLVASLQQLADDSKTMHTDFERQTSEVQKDTAENLKTYKNFDEQEQSINALVSKLQESRAKTDQLNDRLESARLRVEAYEFRDSAKQAKQRTRWRLTWAGLVALAMLIIAIVVARDRERVGEVVGQQLQRIGDLVDDVAAPARLRPSPSENPYLKKLFDDL